MWIILSILILFLLIFLWVLWARIVVCVNSYQQQYYFSLGGLIKVQPFYRGQEFYLGINLPFYSVQVNPLENKSTKSKTKKVKSAKPAVKKKSRSGNGRKLHFTFYLNMVRDVLKTFTVRKLKLDVDTGDFVLNAQLTPVVMLLNQGPAQIQVNYLGRTNLWIEVENQLIRLVPLIFRLIRNKYL
jgi:hypothetical protein